MPWSTNKESQESKRNKKKNPLLRCPRNPAGEASCCRHSGRFLATPMLGLPFFFHVANKLVVIHSGLMGDLNPFGCSDKSCRQKMTFYRRSECVSAECNGHMNVHMKALRGRVHFNTVFMIKWTFAASYQLSIRRCCRHTR